MSKARNIADAFDANGDVAVSALDNVPPNTALVDSSDNTVLDTATGDAIVTGKLSSNKFELPTYASDSAANAAGANFAGSMYFNSGEYKVKTYNGVGWTSAGEGPLFTSIFDLLGDGSAVSLHRLNGNTLDEGGIYGGNFVGSWSYSSTPKFGSNAANVYGNGTYFDIAGIPRIYAVSFWAMATGVTSNNGYLIDFRHDNPANGRSYLYTSQGTKTIDMGNDSTTTNRTGDIWINGVKFTSGTYTFPLGQWVHVVLSANATDTFRTWDQGIRFGNRSDGSTEGLFGQFDQIRTFNRALNQTDVDKLYAETEAP